MGTHQQLSKMLTVYLVWISSLLANCTLAMRAATCALGKHPIDKGLFFKKISAFSACTPEGMNVNHSVRIEPWAVIYQPFNLPTYEITMPFCREEIVLHYRRSDRMPIIYHRPAKNERFDCSKIFIDKLMAWGPTRSRFKRLISQMGSAIEHIRISACDKQLLRLKPQLSRQEANYLLNRERIATAAFSYVNGVTFNSFLCVNIATYPE